jgi:hypothetical protein
MEVKFTRVEQHLARFVCSYAKFFLAPEALMVVAGIASPDWYRCTPIAFSGNSPVDIIT